MAFPIVKMENRNPQNVPFQLDYVDPDLIQQCLGPRQAPPQTAAPTVETPSHTYAVNSPLDTMAHPKCVPKSTPSRGPIPEPHYLPHLCTRPTYMVSNGIRNRSAVFFTMHWTDRQTDRRTYRPTERSRESLTTIARSAQRAPQPKK